ncbi:MAG: hypothetical protein ACRECO_06250 [Xanthobacteraceae bacterium]
MRDRLLRLWRGDLALRDAFWDYAVIYGTLANLLVTVAALAILAANLPGLLALAVFLLPLPYNIVAVVGVWRSAARYSGPPVWANLARIAVVVWAVLATLI